jgi:D-alanyl-D-alanine carboxypeptidase
MTATVRGRSERELATGAIQAGRRDVNELTNLVFYARHPEMTGRKIRPQQRGLVREWLSIRDRLVRPAIAAATPSTVPAPGGPSRLRSTQWLRSAWSDYECAEGRMVPLRIFGTLTPVNPLTRTAFTALEQALRSAGYKPRSVWNYNCRDIKDQPGRRSLHAYGLALDIDPRCNPHRRGASGPARFSPSATQRKRCEDVQAGWADTAFTPAQVAAAEGLQTVDGLQVFAWGGRWASSPDSMHFQINVGPHELRRGVNPPLPASQQHSDIGAVGRQIQAMGYHVSEHPQFGGVNPVHTQNSYHYRGRAIDVNWYPSTEEPAMLDRLYDWIRANVRGYRELLWRAKGHYDHLHLAI